MQALLHLPGLLPGESGITKEEVNSRLKTQAVVTRDEKIEKYLPSHHNNLKVTTLSVETVDKKQVLLVYSFIARDQSWRNCEL